MAMTRGLWVIGWTVPNRPVNRTPVRPIRAPCCEFWCKFPELEFGGVTVDARPASGSGVTETHSVHTRTENRILNKRCVGRRRTTCRIRNTGGQNRSGMYTPAREFPRRMTESIDERPPPRPSRAGRDPRARSQNERLISNPLPTAPTARQPVTSGSDLATLFARGFGRFTWRTISLSRSLILRNYRYRKR